MFQYNVGKSSISGVLGAQVRNEIIVEVTARAESLSIAKGRFAALIFEKWFADGCPPVTPADAAMEMLRNHAQAAEKPQAVFDAGRKKLAKR